MSNILSRLGSTFLLTFLLAGCASSTQSEGSFRPCMLSGNTLINNSVGFKGVSLTFPDAYEAEHILREGKEPTTYAELALSITRHVDSRGGTQLEHVAFGTNKRGIAFTIIQHTAQIGPRYEDEFVQTNVMASVARNFNIGDGSNVARGVRKIGSRQVACVSKMSPDETVYISVRTLLYRPCYALVFVGACSTDQKAQLDTDLDATVASITASKN